MPPSPSPSPSPTPSPSPSPTPTPPARNVTPAEIEAKCPDLHSFCDSDSGCSSAWSCMQKQMTSCTEGGQCVQDAAQLFPKTSGLEELAACLGAVCSPTPSPSPSPTPSPTPSPAPTPPAHDVTPAQVEARCPDLHSFCDSDAGCTAAWSCMQKQMTSCTEGSRCVQDAAQRFPMTSGLEELAGCLGAVCSKSARDARVIV